MTVSFGGRFLCRLCVVIWFITVGDSGGGWYGRRCTGRAIIRCCSPTLSNLKSLHISYGQNTNIIWVALVLWESRANPYTEHFFFLINNPPYTELSSIEEVSLEFSLRLFLFICFTIIYRYDYRRKCLIKILPPHQFSIRQHNAKFQ